MFNTVNNEPPKNLYTDYNNAIVVEPEHETNWDFQKARSIVKEAKAE